MFDYSETLTVFGLVKLVYGTNLFSCAINTATLSSNVVHGPTYSNLSKRPGRNKAGSIKSGLFVAAKMKICFCGSLSVRNFYNKNRLMLRSLNKPEVIPSISANN